MPTRRGLSTLELVIALPILLGIMALMINFGVVSCWKVRGLSMARNAVWSTRYPRSGATNPRPAYWPDTAGVGLGGGESIAELDDPRVDQPVARGPVLGLITGSGVSLAVVNEDLLDPTLGLRAGSASLSRIYPMLGNLGTFRVRAEALILDDCWRYGEMSWQLGDNTVRLHENTTPRIPVIYEYDKQEQMATAYVQAVLAIYYATFQDALRPLDNDEEFIRYGQLFGWGGAPDFHPRLSRFCSLDRALAGQRVDDLIVRIQGRDDPRAAGLAERMARSFIGLYERVIQEYETLIDAEPPPSAGEIAAMQADIGQLQQKIDTLNQFLATLEN
ncbi:MAG: hypothetical protein GX594_03910 [Pirellulaceae bacterium]|nr:hypothetical protein [Pirellulaceae bacterium]